MLVDQKAKEEKQAIFEKGKIIAVRIITGDEIIGQIESFDREFVVLNQPCALAMQKEGIGLVPATMLGDPSEPVTYQRSSIIATMSPNKQFLEVYEQHISAIQIPKKGGIVIPK